MRSKFKGHSGSITLEWYIWFTMVFLYTLVLVGKRIFFKRLSKISWFLLYNKTDYSLNNKYETLIKIKNF